MKTVEVKMVVDTDEAVRGLNKVEKGIEDVGDKASETSKEVTGVGQAAAESKVGFYSMSAGIKAVGTALKVAGIGLIISVLAGLTDAFSRNKQIMDEVSIVLNTMGQLFQQVLTAVVDTYNAVAKSSENFDALGTVIGNLIKMSFIPLELAFYSIVLASQTVKVAYESMFGDLASQTKAQSELIETGKTIAGLGKEFVDLGLEAANSMGEAIGEVVNIGKIAGENLSKISLEAANNQAIANQNAIQGAALAEAQSARLVAQYEREAELQRQIRDDISLSVTERQEANDKLAVILDEQEKALLAQADAIIAGAQAELQKNDSIENQAALISAVANQEQVLADIAGKRSEQLVNQVALKKEELDLTVAVTDAEKQRQIDQKNFEASQETDPYAKLEAQRLALEAERLIIAEDLEAKRLLYAEGTAERVAAEEEYKNQKQLIDNDITANNNAALDQREKDEEIFQRSIEQLQMVSVDAVGSAFGILGQFAEDNKALQIASILGEAGANAAKIIMSTNVANLGALSTPQAIATSGASAVPVIAANNVSMGIGLANTAAAAIQGVTALGGSGSPDTSGESIEGSAEAPSFNLVEGSEGNQIQNSIQSAGDVPVRAFVVAQDVTSQQSLDRQIEQNAGV